jgi:dTDP-glucose 4,6-dehydratase
MKVLVTGAAGFIGSHLVGRLLSIDDEVIALCSMRNSGNLKRLEEYKDHKNLKVIYHDIACEFNEQLINELGDVQQVYHVAAQPHVDKSVKDPRSTIQSNVIGTLNVLEYARKLKNLERFLYFSTDEVFGPADSFPHREYSAFNPTNPYSASKAAAEDIVTSYYYSYKMPIIITHCMNVFGEKQQAAAFIPTAIKKAMNNETISIHVDSNGNVPSRNYVYVSDVIDAIILLMVLLDYTRKEKIPKFNIGQPMSYSIETIARNAFLCAKTEQKIEMTQTARAFVDTQYSLNTDRLNNLGWEPEYGSPFWSRLFKVFNWYMENPEWLN